MIKLFSAAALGFVLIAAPAFAVTPEAQPVGALDDALISLMKAGSAGASFQSRYGQIDPLVKQTLNLPVILQNSVGFEWSTIPAAQKQALETVFEQFTVASYVNGFSSYGGQKIQLLPEERSVGAKKIVETQIVPGDGSAPTRLDYVMSDAGGAWQASDVLFNGTISKVAVQASDFSSEVTTGDATPLITALKAKVKALSGGALPE